MTQSGSRWSVFGLSYSNGERFCLGRSLQDGEFDVSYLSSRSSSFVSDAEIIPSMFRRIPQETSPLPQLRSLVRTTPLQARAALRRLRFVRVSVFQELDSFTSISPTLTVSLSDRALPKSKFKTENCPGRPIVGGDQRELELALLVSSPVRALEDLEIALADDASLLRSSSHDDGSSSSTDYRSKSERSSVQTHFRRPVELTRLLFSSPLPPRQISLGSRELSLPLFQLT